MGRCPDSGKRWATSAVGAGPVGSMILAIHEAEATTLPESDEPVILVIDDDHLTCSALFATLSMEGFAVVTASSADEGMSLLASARPALVILDTQIGDSDGFTLFHLINAAAPWVPVIMATAEGDDLQAALALEAGAADHVTKPARPRELTARIRAVLRRMERQSHAAPTPATAPTGAYDLGPITIDTALREATLGGVVMDLSRKEFDLLTLLVSEGGRVVTRRQCMDRIWRDHKKGDSRTLDTHMKRLRKKIEVDPAEPVHLLTVRGVGYRFRP